MSFSIKAWKTFSKKPQSTKLPPTSGYYTISQVTLKEKTSIYSPVFILEFMISDDDFVYIQWGNRYYSVNNIVITSMGTTVNSCIKEYYCTLDPYATYRKVLGGGGQKYLMERQTLSSVSYYESSLKDSFLQDAQTASLVSMTFNFFDLYYITSPQSTACMVQFFSPSTGGGGYVTLVTSKYRVDELLESLLKDPYVAWNNTYTSGEIPESFQKTLVLPGQFIKSIRVLPISYDSMLKLLKEEGRTETSYAIGWTNFLIAGVLAPIGNYMSGSTSITERISKILIKTGYIQMPSISDTRTLPYYFYSKQNMKITLYTDVYGTIDVPPEYVYTPRTETSYINCEAGPLNSQLAYDIYMDFYTGESTLVLKSRGSKDNFTPFTEITAPLGFELPIQEVSTSYGRSQAQATQGVREIYDAKQGAIRDTVSGVATSQAEGDSYFEGIVDSISGFTGMFKNAGGNNQVTVTNVASGSGSLPMPTMYVTIEYHVPETLPSDYNEVFGRPVNGMKTVVTGFNKILSPNIEFSGTQTERNMILQIMKNGYYYE